MPQFSSDAEIRAIGEGLLDRSLPKPQWTHAGHCVATLYLMHQHPELALERDLPGIIARYNESTGTPNSDTGGYHETITQFYIRALEGFVARLPSGLQLFEICNRLLASPVAAREFPFRYYSKPLLFSVAARRHWVEPDLAPLDFEPAPDADITTPRKGL